MNTVRRLGLWCIAVWLVIAGCIFPLAAAGQVSPPAPDERAVRDALNGDSSIVQKGGKVGAITFGTQTNQPSS
jgi:hypothetical protein